MIATRHTQSLTDFRQNATETLERIGRTGEAELITVNGEAKAVLLSPAAYDAMARELEDIRFYASMQRAMEEHKQGKGRPVDEVFREIREGLLAEKQAAKGRA